jgi:hypothetical protein
MLDDVSCYKATKYDPEICKDSLNWNSLSSVTGNPTHKQNQTLYQIQTMLVSFIFYFFSSLYCDSVHYTAHTF